MANIRAFKLLIVFFLLVTSGLTQASNTYSKKINQIKIIGNKLVDQKHIIDRLPYKEGLEFDPEKASIAISNLYATGKFKQISVEVENVTHETLDVFIFVEEKKILEKFIFKGNNSVKTKDLMEKLELSKKESIDLEDMETLAKAMEQLFKEEGFFFVSITPSLIPNKENPNKVQALFQIKEGIKSLVRQISFIGNNHFTDRKLRNLILTNEYWLLGFIFGAGKYIPDMVNVDKNRLEHFYKDNGYLMAKVTNVDVKFSKDKKQIFLIFNITEGEVFTVSKVEVPGDDVYLEEDLLPHVAIVKGNKYPHSKVIASIDVLKELWGEKGYVNADIYPQVTPNEETKEVDITFYAERGNKVYANRIDITGNEITKDKIIRRMLDVEEGDLITTKKLQRSQNNVGLLSYFDRGGVNWKMHRINDELADLELSIKEALTGQFNLNASYGSSEHSNKSAIKTGIVLEKRNFMGEGVDVGLNAQVQLARKGSRWFDFHVEDPHLFDSNISGRINLFNRSQEFDEWHNVTATPSIQEYGGIVTLGFRVPKIDKYTSFAFEIGLEDLKPKRVSASGADAAAFQPIIDNSFMDSVLQWFGLRIFKDTRNHSIYPSTGYRFEINNKITIPSLSNKHGFIKSEVDMSYYTSLIGEDSLVLMLHGKAGVVYGIGGKHIPYKEYYHMGGQKSIRGFKFGEIGPSWKNQDPLGSRNAVQLNTELIFPLIPDYSMKAHLFYDAGSGWDTDPRGTTRKDLIRRNKFNFRQAVGFGLKLMQPQPMQIDWGYKLDRDKAQGESPHEFHLSANVAF